MTWILYTVILAVLAVAMVVGVWMLDESKARRLAKKYREEDMKRRAINVTN